MLYTSIPTLAFWIIYPLFGLCVRGGLASPSTIFLLISRVFLFLVFIFCNVFLLLFSFVSISFVILT